MDLRIFALVVILFAQAALSQVERPSSFQNICGSKTSCHECIQSKGCSWCLAPEFGDRARCFLSEFTSSACAEEYVWNPDNIESIDSAYNRNLTRSASGSFESSASGGSGQYGSSGSSGESIVQIAPQRVELKLRMNEMHKLEIKYAQAVDYPVDLYYLMDLSKSMEDDKEKLSDLGNLLSDTMKSLTSNFRLGFGSFVDKVLMPYVSTVPKKLISPCDKCEAPYGFKNHLRLSTNTTTFAEEVKRAAVSGNLDAPEGGFDAIMQAVVCREQIGWRDQARRLLVFSTDAGFHYAGDGKLGGVITPNDGECHLDREMYTHSSILDYPSISQVNYKVKNNSINVIFAVTQQQHEVYKKLSEHIEGSSSAILSDDSSNVVDLVKNEYSKISSSVEMKDNANSAIKVKYFSKCKGDTLIETSKCDGLKVGDVVTFEAEIMVTSCPVDRNEWKQTFQIYPVGINENTTIHLEMLCDCPCEHQGHPAYKENSEMCSSQGTSTCGICDCDHQHFGRKCECSNFDLHLEENSGCQGLSADNTTIGTECNGRGNCVCNQCECEKRTSPDEIISGKFCECDNFSCDRHNGLLCSGPDKGTCTCGNCICKAGWKGEACDCKDSNTTCLAPNSPTGLICSGHGTCECGACRCESNDEGRYSGKFCEKCPTCSGRCAEFKDCVQCQMYKTGPLDAATCASNCTLFTPVGVDTVHPYEENDEYLCTYYDEDDCRFQFVYSEIDDKINVKAQQDRECPPKVFMLGIVLGVIGFIVLIGLAMLLLWKLLTTIHDQREFANFEKERIAAKWDTGENPIYKQATSTFKNPTYAGK